MLSLSRKGTKTFFGYLAASIGVGIFGAIYEAFSFGVYSPFMALAFLVPLAASPAPLLARRLPTGPLAEGSFRGGVACLTVGSLVRGALEIYGTANSLWIVYPIVSALLFAASAAALFAGRNKKGA